MKKNIALSVLLVICMGVVFAIFSRDHLLEWVLRDKLKSLETRLGETIQFKSATLRGLNKVIIRELRLGNDRWITLQRVEVTLDTPTLLMSAFTGAQPMVKRVYLYQPQLKVEEDTIERGAELQRRRLSTLLSRLKNTQSLPQNGSSTAERATSIQDRLMGLPQLEVYGGRISGIQGRLFLHQIHFTLDRGLLRGGWLGEAPQTGYCNAEGSYDFARVYCNDDFNLPIGNRFEVAGRQLEWSGGPEPFVNLQGLYLKVLNQGKVASLPFSEVKLDLNAGLKATPEGQYPLSATIVFPGGGRIAASGYASSNEVEMTAQVGTFPMNSLAQGQKGTLNAEARVWSNWREGAATFEGRLSLLSAVITHPKLAEEPVGPFDLSAEGTARLIWLPQDPKRFKVSIENAQARLGHISGRLNASWDQVSSQPHLQARFDVPQLNADRFAASIPRGLLPHLQPIELAGKISFNGEIDLDFEDLDQTKLKFSPNLNRLKVISYNEMINFNELEGSFDTKFEMPDGEVLTRVAGPETERWVELDEMPKLLPVAVISQEDGGFFKHGGISLFHIRGSLVRNLKEGRFVRGGSTLTMQLIKNLYLHRRKTLSRKLEEICLAWLIERALTKNELITLYLNIVEFGPNVFGIREAAQTYFNKDPLQLRPEEISALTRLLPGPRLYAPFFERKRFTPAYTNRVNRLLKLLQKRGHLKADDWVEITPTSLWSLPPLQGTSERSEEALDEPQATPSEEGVRDQDSTRPHERPQNGVIKPSEHDDPF